MMSNVDATTNFSTDITFLQRSIASQQLTVRVMLGWTAGVITIGVVVMAWAYCFPSDSEFQKTLFGIGGLLVSTLSVFPLREFFGRREKIASMHYFRDELTQVQGSSNLKDIERGRKVLELLNRFRAKTLEFGV